MVADRKEAIREYAEGIDQNHKCIFNHTPAQLPKDNKKSQISKVVSDARFRDCGECIEWLDDAGMINICYCLNFPEPPLQGNYDDPKCKIYFAGSGLPLAATLDEEVQEIRGPAKVSASIRARFTKMSLAKRWSNWDINSITISGRILPWNRISSLKRQVS